MENQIVDWKSKWDDGFLKWICCFANAQGGCLEIGKDNNGKVVALSNPRKLMDDLPNKIKSTMGIVSFREFRKKAPAWGRGIDKIINANVSAGKPKPEFELIGDGLRVTFYSAQKDTVKDTANNGVNATQEKILALQNRKNK